MIGPRQHGWPGRAPQRVDIGAGLDLHLFDLTLAPSAAQQAWLSEAEQRKAARFVFERDRRRYLAAHVQLRALLCMRCGTTPASLEFAEGEFGKPQLSPPLSGFSFNLSHSEDIAVVLIAERGEVGVDIEMLRPMPEALALAERNFSGAETADLRRVDPAQRDRAFLIGWTRKEACLKAIGSGLSIAPHVFTAGIDHAPCTTTIATPLGGARVAVRSFVHEERMAIAWAWVVPTGEAA